jgi:hypothetical protein
MSESVQAVLGVVLLFGSVFSVMVLMLDGMPLAARILVPAATVGSCGGLVWSMLRKDRQPDLLRTVSRNVFERDGFCFALGVAERGKYGELRVYYQNRYDRPCQARVVIRPARGFFLSRPEVESITLTIDCPGAGFGVARLPFGVPDRMQGKRQRLDVAADVNYPDGRGTMVRFRGGVQVGGANLEGWKIAVTVAGALGGKVVLWKPAQVKLLLPVGVREAVPDEAPIAYELLWRPGEDATKVLAQVEG